MNEVRERLSGKLENFFGETKVIKPETGISEKLEQMEKTPSQRVKESLGTKLEDFLAVQGTFTGKYAASKYLGKPISELMTEERRVDNLIADIEEKMSSLYEEFANSCREVCNKSAGWDKGRTELYVEDCLQRNLVGNGATDEQDIEAHNKYMKLHSELAKAKADKNAIVVAKADYMNQNADLIKEAQENKRRKELEESGLLKELGIVNPDPAKPEEKVEESEEKTDESSISE